MKYVLIMLLLVLASCAIAVAQIPIPPQVVTRDTETKAPIPGQLSPELPRHWVAAPPDFNRLPKDTFVQAEPEHRIAAAPLSFEQDAIQSVKRSLAQTLNPGKPMPLPRLRLNIDLPAILGLPRDKRGIIKLGGIYKRERFMGFDTGRRTIGFRLTIFPDKLVSLFH